MLNTGYESVEQTMVDPTIYVLDKVIWDQYDMVATRAKVIDYIRLYKESRAKCIQTTVFSSVGLTSTIDPNKVFMPTRINNGGFANLSNEKIDAEEIVKYTAPIINSLRQTFTEEEKKYYDCCLATNNSEEYVANILNVSKTGLLPIKNSCILKFALAFGIEIKKKNLSL